MTIFESQYGKTESGSLRSGTMCDTYNSTFFLDNQNNLVGLQCKNILEGRIVGNIGNSTDKLKTGNIVKHVIENKKYDSVGELFEELTIAYSFRITKMTDESNNSDSSLSNKSNAA